jgi:hypothetical protein
MNLETRHAYSILFEKLFKMLGDTARHEVQWAYLYGLSKDMTGIRTVTVDMCRKQAPGKHIPTISLPKILNNY